MSPKTSHALIKTAIVSKDIYAAIAVHDIAQGQDRVKLETVICCERRNVLKLARWEHTPPSVLKILSPLHGEAVQLRIDKNPSTDGKILKQQYLDVDSSKLIGLIAKHNNTSIDVLLEIASCEDDLQIVKAVCTNPNSDDRVLLKVESRFPANFDREIAVHSNTPAALLEIVYSRSNNAFIKAAVVTHEKCPPSLLEEASLESDVMILRHLAGNDRITENVLIKLSQHQDSSVRRVAAGNPLLCSQEVAKLAKDKVDAVRRAVASRSDLSQLVLEYMAKDSYHWVRLWVARNPLMSANALEVLAEDDHIDVRRAVARNPKCSEELLKKLAQDKNSWVRAAVAYQQNTSIDLLMQLQYDDDIDVLSGVASNPHTPQSVLQRLSQSINDDIRRGVIMNKHASRETLLPLLDDPYYLHRLLLVGNKTLSDEDKWAMHDDFDPSVRFIVFKWFARKIIQ